MARAENNPEQLGHRLDGLRKELDELFISHANQIHNIEDYSFQRLMLEGTHGEVFEKIEITRLTPQRAMEITGDAGFAGTIALSRMDKRGADSSRYHISPKLMKKVVRTGFMFGETETEEITPDVIKKIREALTRLA